MIENIEKYVENLKKENPIIKAEKSGCVLARIGIEGEKIETYVENGTLETVNTVKKDENGFLDVIITMASSSGEKIIDKNNHTNTYIIPRNTFNKKYQNADNLSINESFFKPAGSVQNFIQINEDIEIMASWGEMQNLKKGSFLNITKSDDIYGIAYEEFVKTYRIVDEKEIEKEENEKRIRQEVEEEIKNSLSPFEKFKEAMFHNVIGDRVDKLVDERMNDLYPEDNNKKDNERTYNLPVFDKNKEKEITTEKDNNKELEF